MRKQQFEKLTGTPTTYEDSRKQSWALHSDPMGYEGVPLISQGRRDSLGTAEGFQVL